MKITYIKHSGFLIQWEQCAWLFDYYAGDIPALMPDQKVMVFVSHSHGDHFNPEIFSRFAAYPHVEYFMASETRHKVRKLSLPEEIYNKITFLKPHQYQTASDGAGEKTDIYTCHSTDCGVAFLLQYRGRKIYHGGDLNWWVWKGESRQEYNDMTARFQKEIKNLKEKAEGAVDVAFVPLDPRQEEWYRLGMDYFLENIDAKLVFPMHFWEEYSLIERYKRELKDDVRSRKIVPISREGYEVIL
ncbi:MAG: MBL fold metallo-hydrolase [Ruminococcus sp.]|jgi:L-ascorbate metabolism protein UlaG (beta-lactamase superfamily)